MPYIKQNQRKDLKEKMVYAGRSIENAGELNYMITYMIDQYIRHNGGKNYAVINEVIGALECAKLELYRRIAAPYEDTKIKENGDVYSSELLSNSSPVKTESHLTLDEKISLILNKKEDS